jgi:hypothetical protein
MKFTIQFQEFSEQRQQWLTIVFVCKVGLLRFLLYVLRIIEWTFRDGDAYPIHRVVITQGVIFEDKPANTLMVADELINTTYDKRTENTKLHLVA